VTRTCSIAAVQARAKGLRFELVLEPSVPHHVHGDARRISQVLLNLASNAVKFTVAGTVSIRVHADALTDGPCRVSVAIADTGIGIDPKLVDHMFEPFTQADVSTTRVYGGTGLGLAIVRELVELMGGSVGVESRLGEGSVFTLELELDPPLSATGSAASTSSTALEPARWRSTPLVLVAEDGPVNQVVAIRTLERCGCKVEVAANGLEALARLEAQTFDAVLMDCQMPLLDGYEATQELRRREPEGVRTPVIAMTAHAMQGDRERCLAAGMDDYVSKPLRRDDLLAALSRWVPLADDTVEARANGSPQARGAAHATARARRPSAGSARTAGDGARAARG
jgi:CheY-like chemotaxis protein